ncbi:hypothetical protein [Pedobacter superstes]|uniref:aldose epimerase family protein n=1 Tax=Pedobacter superstes TaxID=3133441 RepID=UPI003D75BEAA
MKSRNAPDAILTDAEITEKMEVRTSYPSILFYSGNYLQFPFAPCEGLCLEAQFFPDAPNLANPPTLLNPGKKYNDQIHYSFSWQ